MANLQEEAPKAAQQTKTHQAFAETMQEMFKTFSAFNAFDNQEAKDACKAFEAAQNAFRAFCNSEFARQQTNNED